MKLIGRYPIVFFLLAAVVITYAAGLAWVYAIGAIQRSTGLQLGWANDLVLKFGPSLAGVLAIAFTAGAGGVKDLFRRCVRWRGPIWLYAAALLVQPILLFVVLLLGGYGPDLHAVAIGTAVGTFGIQLVLNVFLGGGLSEELGWRGFMLPALCKRYSPLAASMIVAVAWFGWHIPAYILFNKGASDPILPFVVILFPFSVVLTWAYLRAGESLVVPILLHASINAAFYAMEELLPGVVERPGFQPTFDWRLAAIWCVLGATVVAIWRSLLIRPPATVGTPAGS